VLGSHLLGTTEGLDVGVLVVIVTATRLFTRGEEVHLGASLGTTTENTSLENEIMKAPLTVAKSYC